MESCAVTILRKKPDLGVSLWKWCDKYGSWTAFNWLCQISAAFSQMSRAKWIKPWPQLHSNLAMPQVETQMWLLCCLLASCPSTQGTTDTFSKSLTKTNCIQIDSKCEWGGVVPVQMQFTVGCFQIVALIIVSSYDSERPHATWLKPWEMWFLSLRSA